MRELFRMDRKNYNPEGKIYTRPSARGIVVKDGKVLLNHVDRFDNYEFPGGGIEPNETPEQAMIREVLEETGRVVIPESVREFGVVVRRQRDSMDPDGIFEQRNYYYFCDVTDEIRPRMPDEHEVKEGAKPVWVEDLTEPIRCNEKAFASIGEAFLEREMRVMAMVAELLRGKSPV